MTDEPLKRPRLDDAMKLQAAVMVVKKLIESGAMDSDADLDDLAEDVARYGEVHMDGFQIARALETRASWDCDIFIVEILNNFPCHCDDILYAASKVWAAATIMEPLAEGTRVKYRQYTGEIADVSKHHAHSYRIKCDGDTRGYIIAPFEDVTVIS